MKTLLLRLISPMQSWGTDSRFTTRQTDRYPSKSGIVGLLAAAQGRRRSENIEDLASLRMGVRVDQPGSPLRDFQTVRTLDGRKSMPLSNRFYLQDAVFVAAVAGDDQIIEGLAKALSSPAFPLYLGRKACVPTAPILMGVTDQPLVEALKEAEWQARKPYQRRRRTSTERLEIIFDAEGSPEEFAQDYPVSFDSTQRQYSLRAIQRSEVLVQNPHVQAPEESLRVQVTTDHDPLLGLA